MRKALTLLVLGAALVATAILLLPSAAAADGNDDYLNATLVSTGSNGPFDIDPSGDPDWYSFTLFTLANTRVELNGSSGDTIIYLYDANISYMDYDDDDGVGSFSRLDDPLQPGTYFVYVQAADGVSTIYGYYLTLDPVEPFPLAEGTNGPFYANTSSTQNWFSFDVVETSNVRIELNGSSGDSVMYLYDADFSYIAYDDDGASTGYWSMIYRTLDPGGYIAVVQPLYGTLNNYYCTLTRTSLLGPDGNGLRDNATAVFLGMNGPFDIDPIGDLDWYVITFPSAGIAEIQTNGSSGSTVLTLYNSYGYWLAQDYSSGYKSFSRIQASVGSSTYYMLVQQSYSGATIYNYTLEIELYTAPGPDDNDDRENATVVGEGTSGDYSLVDYDADWYSFTAATPGTLRVETNGEWGGGNIVIYNTDRTYLANGYYSGNQSFEVASVLVDAGTYLIEVTLPYGFTAVMSYNVTITFTPWMSADGNDFRSTAQRLVQGLNGPFAILPYSDQDWYFFDQAEVGYADIEVLGASGYATEQLYNKTGALLDGSTYGTESISIYLQPSRYYVKLTSTYGYYTVSTYYLNLTLPDTSAPAVVVASPANGTQVDSSAVRITGTTEPGAQVWVNGAQVVVDVNGAFSVLVEVALGTNTINITSGDYVGNVANSTVTVEGIDPNVSLTNQLNQARQQLSSVNAQLSAERAAHTASANQASATAAQLNTTESKWNETNASLAAARVEADAQRGAASMNLLLAIAGFASAAAVAVLMMRRRPQAVMAPQAPAPSAPAPVIVAVPPPPAQPEAPTSPAVPPAPLSPPSN